MGNKIKYHQLVEHKEPFPHFCLHEALIEKGETFPYWVGEAAILKYDSYRDALHFWGMKEPYWSGIVDILSEEDIESLHKKFYFEDEEEINFD